jgi:hypothetical protein
MKCSLFRFTVCGVESACTQAEVCTPSDVRLLTLQQGCVV